MWDEDTGALMAGELIETLWNVNLTGDLDNRTTAFELIETLWNVNIVMSGRSSTEVSELIETLWNVNSVPGCSDMLLHRN